MPRSPARTRLLKTPEELAALGSAVRLDIVEQLKLGGAASARELAGRLERAPSSLYHHLGVLEAAGLIAKGEERRVGRRTEAVYHLVASRLKVARGAKGADTRRALSDIGRALLRHASRAYGRAVENPETALEGPARAALLRLLALRLDARRLRTLNEELDRLVARWSAIEPDEGEPTYRLVLVLTPADPAKSRRRAKRQPPRPRPSA